jgi:hypothetical protein
MGSGAFVLTFESVVPGSASHIPLDVRKAEIADLQIVVVVHEYIRALNVEHPTRDMSHKQAPQKRRRDTGLCIP